MQPRDDVADTVAKAPTDAAGVLLYFREPVLELRIHLPRLTAQQSREFFQGKSYDAEPFIIPDTSKGKTLQVKVESSDERGLKSNIVDLKIALK